MRELAQSSGEVTGQPGVVVVVLDATALARSLYLLAQVAETGVPLVVALTMLDLAATATDSPTAAVEPDTLAAALAASLGVPVVPVDARNRADGGLRDLARAVDDVAAHPRRVTGIAALAPSCCCGPATVAIRALRRLSPILRRSSPTPRPCSRGSSRSSSRSPRVPCD